MNKENDMNIQTKEREFLMLKLNASLEVFKDKEAVLALTFKELVETDGFSSMSKDHQILTVIDSINMKKLKAQINRLSNNDNKKKVESGNKEETHILDKVMMSRCEYLEYSKKNRPKF